MSSPVGLEQLSFGQRLRKLRKSYGWTQITLADKAKLTPDWISHFECDRRSPTMMHLKALCRALEFGLTKPGVAAIYLLDLEEKL